MMPPSDRLKALGWELPPPPTPAGSYAPVVVDRGTAYVAGQIVVDAGKAVSPGRVDEDVSVERAKELARTATLQALSAIAATVGSIDRIDRIVRVAVFVASSPTFVRAHEVANGATEPLFSLFGEAGRPARVAVGVAALPLNAPVEVELWAAIR